MSSSASRRIRSREIESPKFIMEKRVILAFVLSFAVIYAFTSLYSPRPGTTEPAASVQTSPPQPAKEKAPAPIITAEKAETTPADNAAEARADKAEDFVVETPLYIATVSNVGGVLKSYKLKMYSDGEGHPLELVD